MHMNCGSVTSENDVKGAERLPAPAHYLAVVADIDASKDDHIAAKFNVVAAEDPRAVGKTHEERYFYKGDENNREYSPGQIRLALVTGAISPGTSGIPNWPSTRGRLVVFHVEERTSKKKGAQPGAAETERVFTNISDWGCAIYSPTNPEVQGVLSQPWAQSVVARMNGPQIARHPQPPQQPPYPQPPQQPPYPQPAAQYPPPNPGYAAQQSNPQFTPPGGFAPPAPAPAVAVADGRWGGL